MNETHLNDKFAELRKRAEEALANSGALNLGADALSDVRQLLSELHIYQIELEMQNEELRQTQTQLAREREKYADLYNFAPMAYFTVDHNDIIVELNLAAAELLGHEPRYLIDRPITPYLTSAALREFILSREKAHNLRSPQTCELTIRRRDGAQAIVQVRTIALQNTEPLLWRSVMTDITERKQAESQLREQASWKRFISDAVITTDTNLLITNWNEAATQIYGWSAEEAIGKKIDVLLKTEFQSVTQTEAQTLLTQNGMWRGTIRQRTKSGKELYIEASVTFLKDEKEQIVGGVTINRDITDRRHTEEALRESEERYRSLVELSPDGIGIYSKGVIAFLNRAGLEMLGAKAAGDLIGKPMMERVHPDSRAVVKARSQKLQEGVTAPLIEEKFLRLDGTAIEVEAIAQPFVYQGAPAVQVVFRDISERKKAEKALRESEERFRSLAFSFDDVIYTLDNQQRHTGVYGDWVRKAGLTPEFFLGKTAQEIFGAEAASLHEEANKLALSGEATIYEWSAPAANGFNYYQTSVSPLRNSQGEIIGIVGVGRDITERKKAENILQARLRIIEFASGNPLDALLQNALDELCALSNSPIGFFHFVEADQKTLSLQAWSTRTLQEFCKAEGRGLHYDIDQAGVWVDCVREGKPVIHNDYPSLPHRNGLPAGHAAVVREMVFPIVRKQRIVAIIGVGNKATEYTQEDLDYASHLADLIWDITERKRAEEQLRKLSRAVEQSQVSVIITDVKGAIEYVNPKFCEITGYMPEEIKGKNPRFLKFRGKSSEQYKELWKTILAGHEWRGEFHNRKKNGESFWESTIISPISDESGGITHFVAVKEDITARKIAEESLRLYVKEIEALRDQLREQAIRDSLTGLYNRRYLDETMNREIARAKRENYPISIMVMDVDHFKKFNDAYGHRCGDEILMVLGGILQENTRVADIACRYGGDEFVILLPSATAEQAARRAATLCATFSAAYVLHNEEKISATLSIGVAVYPQHGDHGDAIFRAADAALYRAKQAGRNCVCLAESVLSRE